MACNLTHYWQQHVDSLLEMSVAVEPQLGSDAMVLEHPSDPRSGVVDARVWFDDGAYLNVWERVEISEDEIPKRTKYNYHLMVDGAHADRKDYDPSEGEDLEHHRNRPRPEGGVTHEPVDRITLKSYVQECWESIQDWRDQFADGH